MPIISLAFHLFVECSSTAARSDHESAVIELDGPTALAVRDRQLTAVNGSPTGAVVLEKVTVHNEPLLAMTQAGDGPPMRVNGVLAGPVQLLRTADVIEFPHDGPVAHVTLFTRPYCGAARAEHVGRECPVCLTPIGPGVPVSVCAHCQSVMHEWDESASKPGESLECARMSPHCPVCSRPLVRKEGYVYVPEV